MISQSITYEHVMAAPLLQTYVSHFSALKTFYSHDPSDREIWPRMMDQVSTREIKPPRKDLVSILTRQNIHFGADETILRNIKSLEQPESFVISTGHQVGLFTGPLYTIYKAITTIKLAKRVSDESGLPVVPVFWMAADDHDFAEINHVFVSPSEMGPQKLELRSDDPNDRRSAASRLLGRDIKTLVDQYAAFIPDGLHKREVIDCLNQFCLPEVSLSDAFARLMVRLFDGYGLIMVDPTDPALKPLMGEVFTKEISQPLRSTHAMLESSEQIRKAGFTPQVERSPEAVNLFVINQEHRNALTYENDHFVNRQNDMTYERDDLLKLITDHPEQISHNVVTRPLVQDALFPSLAYIGGPSEVAYYAQFGKVYDLFNLPFPVIYPRTSLTILEPKVERNIIKHDLSLVDFTKDINRILDQRVQDDMPDEIVQSLKDAKANMHQHYETLHNQVAMVDPVLQRVVEASIRKSDYALNKLEEKTIRAVKRQNKIIHDQIFNAGHQIYPSGQLQERVLNIWPFISRYGFEFIDQLIESVDTSDFSHHVVTL